MDIFVEQTIHAAPEQVARIMFDPAQEGRWVEKAGHAELLTPGPLAVGSRVRHDAGMLGMTIHFVTEVTALEPDRRLEMEIVEGPVRGVMTYQVAPTAGGAIASVHVKDRSKPPVPTTGWARKHQVQANLARLANVVMHETT